MRLAPLHLPAFASKYGGSALYAIMIYWIAAACLPRSKTLNLALLTFAASAAVELFKLVRTPALDAFRLTVAGRLTLGRFFSPLDLAAYAAGIVAVAFFDYQRTRGSRLE